MSYILKALKGLINVARSGWMLRGVPPSIAENIAEHSFIASLICLDLCTNLGLDSLTINRIVVMTLIHDLPEAFIGDIVRYSNAEVERIKKVMEFEAIEKNIDNEYIKNLFREYKEQQNFESNMAKLCDYIATYIVGYIYRSQGFEVNDIIENTYRNIAEISEKLRIDDRILKKYMDIK